MAKAGPITALDGCTFWSDGHLCERGVRHCDQCMCKCGHRWDRAPEQVEPQGMTITLDLATVTSDVLLAVFNSIAEEMVRRREGKRE